MLDLPSTLELFDHLADQVHHVEGVFKSVSEAETFLGRLRAVRDLVHQKGSAQPSYAALTAVACPGLTDESLRVTFNRFQGQLEKSATKAGLRLKLIKPTGRGLSPDEITCHFEGKPLPKHDPFQKFTSSTTALRPDTPLVRPRIAAFRSSELEKALTSPLQPAKDGREQLHFFVSYAHSDSDQAKKLLQPLITDLQLSKRFQYTFWRDHLIQPGERWHEEIQDALRTCDFGIALISRDYLSSKYITEQELPSLVAGDKPLIPVCLGLMDFQRQNLHGLQDHQIYRYETTPGQMRCFMECRPPNTEKFVRDLAGRIEQKVEKVLHSRKQALVAQAFADPKKLFELKNRFPLFHQAVSELLESSASPSPTPQATPEEPNAAKLVQPVSLQEALDQTSHLPELLKACANQMLPPENGAAVQAAIAAMRLSEAQSLIGKNGASNDDGQSTLERERQDALSYLTRWFEDPEEPCFAAVLGELGSGKTKLLQMLARELSQREKENAPPVFFIDLRNYTGSQETDLEHILSDQLRRHDRSGLLKPADIIQAVQNGGGLIIFDGLDEKIIHLPDGPRQRFISELFRVLPPDVMDLPAASGRGRIIISCRSHYFPSVLALASGLTGQDREQVKSRDYSACIMLPWRDEQVEDYLRQTLGPDKVASALETIAAVHNLTELSRRPYLLSKIVPQIHRLELERAAGRQVNEASLYRGFVEEWLLRDEGKHVFTKEHKQLMMERLAADLWRDNAREWPWTQVADWLDGFLFENPRIAARYNRENVPADILNADFRTATFFLRPDSSKDAFRFAHTSLQEFFLACHLLRTLSMPDPSADWNLPRPSIETLDFFGQLLALEPEYKQGRALLTLGGLMGSDCQAAAALAFEYWLRAIERGHPEPGPTHVRLPGYQLDGRRLKGHGPGRLLNLTGADLRGVSLNQAELQFVNLSGAHLNGVQARQSLFKEVFAAEATFTKADLCGVQWRGGSLKGAQLSSAKIHGCEWIGVDLTGVELPADWDHEAVACGALQTPPVDARETTLFTRIGHSGGVNTCAWSPDGAKLLSGSSDKTLKIWDALSGSCLTTLEGHSSSIQSCRWSANNEKLASGSNDNTLKIWDAQNGQCLATLEGHSGPVNACDWSPDCERLLSGSSDNTLKIWDTKSAQCLQTLIGHSELVIACAWSPDGSKLLSASLDKTLKIWDAQRRRCMLTLQGHSKSVTACTWSPDGSKLLSGSSDNTLKVWDAITGQCLHTLQGHSDSINACSWSPNGRKLLSASHDQTLRVWDADSGLCQLVIRDHSIPVTTCIWSPDNLKLLSGSFMALKIWDAEHGKCQLTMGGHSGEVYSCSWSPDGRRLTSGAADKTVKVWGAARGLCLFTLKGHSRPICKCEWSPNGEKLASLSWDGTLKIWNARSADCLLTLKVYAGEGNICTWSPDSKKIITSSANNTLKIIDSQSGQCLQTIHGYSKHITGCSWSHDGKKILSCSMDGTIIVWDTQSCQRLLNLQGHSSEITACSWNFNDEKFVSTSWDQTLKIWDATNGICLHKIQDQPTAARACTWSPDGGKLLTANYDGTLKIRDAESGSCMLIIQGHSSVIRACAWSPDGTKLLSGSDDKTLKVWDAHSGECLWTGMILPDGQTASLDARGQLLSCSQDAWRWLGWRWTDPRSGDMRVLPAEHFGPLPVQPIPSLPS